MKIFFCLLAKHLSFLLVNSVVREPRQQSIYHRRRDGKEHDNWTLLFLYKEVREIQARSYHFQETLVDVR